MREAEVKVRVDDFDPVRARLEEIGATRRRVVERERHLIFRPLSGSGLDGEILRLRLKEKGEGVLTWKGRQTDVERVSIREERSTRVSDAQATRDLLERLGLGVALEFDKRREYWEASGVTVVLDEMRFGRFVELEGAAAAMTDVLFALGLDSATRVDEAYVLEDPGVSPKE